MPAAPEFPGRDRVEWLGQLGCAMLRAPRLSDHAGVINFAQTSCVNLHKIPFDLAGSVVTT
jgi:hypothetical protein